MDFLQNIVIIVSIFSAVFFSSLFLQRAAVPIVVRYVGCMTEKGISKRLLELEETKNRSRQQEGELMEMVNKRKLVNVPKGDFSGMTVLVCAHRCYNVSFALAGLQGGQRCYCGQTIAGLVSLPFTLCYHRCSGNCRQRCGGTVAMSVYHTGQMADKVKMKNEKLSHADSKFEFPEYRPKVQTHEKQMMYAHSGELIPVDPVRGEEEEGGMYGISWKQVGVALGCVVLVIWLVVIAVFHKMNQTDIFKLTDLSEQSPPNDQTKSWTTEQEAGPFPPKKKNPKVRSKRRRGRPMKGPGKRAKKRFSSSLLANSSRKSGDTQQQIQQQQYQQEHDDLNSDTDMSQNKSVIWEDTDWTDSDSPQTALLWDVL